MKSVEKVAKGIIISIQSRI